MRLFFIQTSSQSKENRREQNNHAQTERPFHQTGNQNQKRETHQETQENSNIKCQNHDPHKLSIQISNSTHKQKHPFHQLIQKPNKNLIKTSTKKIQESGIFIQRNSQSKQNKPKHQI